MPVTDTTPRAAPSAGQIDAASARLTVPLKDRFSRDGPGANGSSPSTLTRLPAMVTVSGPMRAVPGESPIVPLMPTPTVVPAGERNRTPLTAVSVPWICGPREPSVAATSRASIVIGGAPSTCRSSPLMVNRPMLMRGFWPPLPGRPAGSR